jgi:hypothetical protein
MSIFVVTGYWITPPPVLRMKERLLLALCFTKDQHTGEVIREKTLDGLHTKWKIGKSPEEVPTRVHGCTPDEGSNMLKGWDVFEGAGCVCHRAQSCLRVALDKDESPAGPVVRKVKGICAHFHRSTKVIHFLIWIVFTYCLLKFGLHCVACRVGMLFKR